jgi:hypothetical protein
MRRLSLHGRAVLRTSALASVLVVAVVFQSGCNGSGARSGADAVTRRDTRIQHEDCAITSGGAEKIDANADGKPEVTIVNSGGREVCRAVDLNFDGTVDSWIYRDPGGQVRRRETDYDRDGRVDEIAIFQGGVLVQKLRATTLGNKLDTWQFYQGGQLARTERDSDGDEQIDQWWEWPKTGCPLIHSDVDGDGRPDPGATVDYCKETGYVPPERQGSRAPTSPSFEKPGSLPTEVETRPQTEGETKPEPAKPESAPAGEKKGTP